MHIVFVTVELATRENPSGGLATFTANMARLFHRHGHDVDIILVTTKEQNLIFDTGIKVHNIYVPKNEWEVYDYIAGLDSSSEEERRDKRLGLMYMYKSHMVKALIDRMHEHNPIDIVHLCNHGACSLFFDNTIPYVIRISGFLNIWFFGGDTINGSLKYKDNPESYRQKLEILSMKNAPNVIAPSNLLAKIAGEELRIPTDVIESPFVFDHDSWNYDAYEKIIRDANGRYILFYGTMSILKGISVIAELAEKLLRRNRDLRLVLCGRDTVINVGDGILASDYVKEKAADFSDRVIYAGQLTREYLYPVINGAELVILPSRIENLSNACIEAMAMGKIVVATDGASYEQLIDDGVSGFLCKRDNPDDYLDAIERGLNLNKDEKDRMIQEAKNRISELEPNKVYQRFYDYYKKVIAEWNF
ncbi:glycosyltransferase family 4 protein [Butyrivibrio sp. WCD2001]|uniref:glycosyltransferase family 4 protein n=1 Tax=Butyrivibrio sp. WCD2001 TaxID=1280681 RepID=UPI0003FBD1CB|nr:glycosyltransferase family 4 protein [Butyrivibrio sp. WCD2001]